MDAVLSGLAPALMPCYLAWLQHGCRAIWLGSSMDAVLSGLACARDAAFDLGTAR